MSTVPSREYPSITSMLSNPSCFSREEENLPIRGLEQLIPPQHRHVVHQKVVAQVRPVHDVRLPRPVLSQRQHLRDYLEAVSLLLLDSVRLHRAVKSFRREAQIAQRRARTSRGWRSQNFGRSTTSGASG